MKMYNFDINIIAYSDKVITVCASSGCPIADRLAVANIDIDEWPNVLLLVKDTQVGIPHIHCPFIEEKGNNVG